MRSTIVDIARTFNGWAKAGVHDIQVDQVMAARGYRRCGEGAFDGVRKLQYESTPAATLSAGSHETIWGKLSDELVEILHLEEDQEFSFVYAYEPLKTETE